MNVKKSKFQLSEVITYTILAAAVVGAIIYLFYRYPVEYTVLITEDKWGAYGTSVCFGLAGVLLLVLCFTQRPFMQRAAWLLIGVTAIFIAAEEISWGQRIFGIQTPESISKLNIQEELNIHNLEKFAGINIALQKIPAYLILGWLIFSLAVAQVPRFKEKVIRFGVPLVPFRLSPIFLMTPFFYFFQPTAKIDEIVEMLLGVTVLMWATDQYFDYGWMKRPKEFVAACLMIIVLIFACAISVTLDRLHSRNMGWRLNLMASYDYPSFGLYNQAEIIYNYIYDHPEYLKPETRINHGKMLLKRGKRSEAFGILAQEIKRLEAKDMTSANSSKHLRRIGIMLTMMEKSEQADIRFRQAITLDRQNFDLVSDPDKKSKLLWSIAQTLEAQGDIISAITMAKEAKELATISSLHYFLEKQIETFENKLATAE